MTEERKRWPESMTLEEARAVINEIAGTLGFEPTDADDLVEAVRGLADGCERWRRRALAAEVRGQCKSCGGAPCR